jgi:thiamine-phosphate diphosphorylase
VPTEARASPRNAALTLCLITDRRRLIAAMGESLISWQAALLIQIEGAVRGGVDVVQVREADVHAGELARFVKDCVALVEGTATRIVVNDRADVAIAARAHGLHLREASIAIAAARRVVGRGCTIGRSIHGIEGAAASRTADYLIAGSVFETASKPGAAPRLGLDGLSKVVDSAGACPVWAVGGVTPDRIGPIREHGASGAAAIGAFIVAGRRQGLAAAVEQVTRALRRSCDSAGDGF